MIPAAVKQANADADAALDMLDKAAKDNAAAPSVLDALTRQVSQTAPDATPPAGTSEPAPATESEPQPPLRNEPDYRQMYSTLRGKYNAEVPRLQQQISALQSQMTSLLTRESMEPGRSADAPSAPIEPGHSRYLKKEEREQYGDEILDMQARMAKGVAEDVVEQAVQARVAPYLSKIEELEQRVADTSDSSFWDKVEEKIPDAQTINATDPMWFDFLSAVEPGTGLTFRQIGENAYNSRDTARMVRLFEVFFAGRGEGSQGNVTPAEPAARPPVKPGKVADKNAVPPAPVAKPKIRESELKSFYSDVARGRYRGRDKERAEREAILESAVQEGRIVSG